MKFEKDNSCVVYSFGLGADWSFDNAGESNECDVHGFDPSGPLWRTGMYGTAYNKINYEVQYPSRKKTFHNWGVGAADQAIYPPGSIPQEWPGLGDPPFTETNSEPWDVRSVSRIMKDLGHDRLSVLKVDVEGGEWGVLASMLYDPWMSNILATGQIRQFLVEYHWDPNTRHVAKHICTICII
jgi:hypothetical protein